MPYIKQEDRKKFDVKKLAKEIESCGELNYVLTMICKEYLGKRVYSYKDLNEIMGAIECCKLEFYRKVISSYEEVKIDENGDLE